MATHGRVTVGQGVALDSEGVASNVAIVQAEKARQESLNVDGKFIRPDWVAARGLSLGESLRVGSGVTLTDGCVQANHLTTDSAVITNYVQVGESVVKPASIDTPDLSAISANLGTITAGSIGVGSGGVTISNDGGSTGIHIGANQIYAKASGVVTFLVNGPTGEVSARKFTLIADAANSVDLSLGTHVLATSITVGAQTLGDIQTNATTGAGRNRTFYQISAPTASNTGDLWYDSDDNVLYRWNGSNWTTQGVATVNHTFAQASQPNSGMVAGDLWVDTGDGNKMYRYSGSTWTPYRDAGATAGATAVQPGGGVAVDGNKYISTIDMSSGLVIKSSTSTTRTQLTSNGLAAYSNNALRVQIDSTNGLWVANHNDTYPSTGERISLAYSTTEIGKIYASGGDAGFYLEAVSGSPIYVVTDDDIGLKIGTGSGDTFKLYRGSTEVMSYTGDSNNVGFSGIVRSSGSYSNITTLYTSANAAFTTTYLTIGDATRYLRMYIWPSGDPTTFRQTSGGAQGTWGNAGDMGVSLGGSLWFRQSGGWQRQDS